MVKLSFRAKRGISEFEIDKSSRDSSLRRNDKIKDVSQKHADATN
jgi:hypothetical protein